MTLARTTAVRRAAVVTLATISIWIVVGLWVDAQVGELGQTLLGVLTAVVLAALLTLQPAAIRWQTLGVVAIATLGEVVGSLIWGLYEYRLENLPAFVPPGHGLVYLAGISLASLCGARMVLAIASVAAAAWGLAGLTVLPTTDVAGAIGCAFLVVVLLRTRRPVYAGVFLVVAALELYGTALGTWTWASTVPGLELPQGNPPSGVASGYVTFDVLVLWLAVRLRPYRERGPGGLGETDSVPPAERWIAAGPRPQSPQYVEYLGSLRPCLATTSGTPATRPVPPSPPAAPATP